MIYPSLYLQYIYLGVCYLRGAGDDPAAEPGVPEAGGGQQDHHRREVLRHHRRYARPGQAPCLSIYEIF